MSKNFSRDQTLWPDSEIVMLTELNHLYRLPVTPVIIIYTLASFAKSIAAEVKKWRISESNRWPSACKADALANWANPPFLIGSQQLAATICSMHRCNDHIILKNLIQFDNLAIR